MAETLLTVKEVADLYRVKPRTVRTWVKEGDLSFIRTPSGHLRFRRSDVEALLEPQEKAGITTTCQEAV